jgi:hypothetical protein
MAISLNSTLLWPSSPYMPGNQSNPGTLLVDGASEKAGQVFKAPKTGSITKLYFSTFTVTTGATMDVRLETVDASTGLPSGSLQGTNTNASLVIANSDDNKWLTVTLTAAAVVTVGDDLAFVVANPASSFGNMNIACFASGNSTNASRFPYALLFTSSWAKQATSMACGVEYSDGTQFLVGPGPWVNASQLSFSDSSNPDERGLKFLVPFDCSVIGILVNLSASAGATYTVKLYDSVDTVLASVAADGDLYQSGGWGVQHLYLGSEISLTANAVYRLTIRATNATSVAQYSYVEVAANADMAWASGGINCYETTRNNDGAWTDTTTRRPNPWGVIISSIASPLVPRSRVFAGF